MKVCSTFLLGIFRQSKYLSHLSNPSSFFQRFVASLRVRDLRDGNGEGGGAGSVYWLHEEILDDSVTLRFDINSMQSWKNFFSSTFLVL